MFYLLGLKDEPKMALFFNVRKLCYTANDYCKM